jgi:hypothetical protein
VLGRRRSWQAPARRLDRPPLLFLSGQAVWVLSDGLAVPAQLPAARHERKDASPS